MKNDSPECEFCYSKLNVDAFNICPKCDFPVHGAIEEKENFRNENAELEQLIRSADKALSWARFGMLWPWLTAIVLAVCGIIFFAAIIPGMIYTVLFTLPIPLIFITCYFIVPKKPVPILTVAFVLMLSIILYGLYEIRMFLMFPKVWLELIIPAILLFMFGNALFLMIKLEKTLKNKKELSYKARF